MKHCGKNVYLRPMSSDIKGLENLYVGDNTLIPKGSTFYCTRAELRIGNNVTIGAGSVVIKDIPDNSIAVGNPCKPIRFIDTE